MTHSGFEKHNHDTCIADAIAVAERHCADNRLQFTKARRRVFEILLQGHKAMGAYDILALLSAEGQAAQPPVAYRALDFLVQNGFAHKIEKLNAYVACTHPGDEHTPAFLICRACANVSETDTHPLSGNLGIAAKNAGFEIEHAVVEAEGLCPSCQTPGVE